MCLRVEMASFCSNTSLIPFRHRLSNCFLNFFILFKTCSSKWLPKKEARRRNSPFLLAFNMVPQRWQFFLSCERRISSSRMLNEGKLLLELQVCLRSYTKFLLGWFVWLPWLSHWLNRCYFRMYLPIIGEWIWHISVQFLRKGKGSTAEDLTVPYCWIRIIVWLNVWLRFSLCDVVAYKHREFSISSFSINSLPSWILMSFFVLLADVLWVVKESARKGLFWMPSDRITK